MGNSQQKTTKAEEQTTTQPPVELPKIEERFKEFPLIEAPKDEEGFIQSFSIDDEEGIKKFFDEYGFVVVNGVLSESDIKETIEEIWVQLETTKYGWDGSQMIDRNDPSTWTDDSWPQAVKTLGILGGTPAIGKMAWKNRQNEKLYKIFSLLMNKKELWASIDRYGVMRPTVNVPVGKAKDGETIEVADRPKWKTAAAWIHWDLNPWKWIGTEEGVEYEFSNFITENNGSKNNGILKLQGLVSLTESREDDGGFCTVSGFHKFLPEWTKLTSGTDYAEKANKKFDFVSVPKGDPMFNQIQKISCRAGSLIVWRGEQPHCNYPNNSNRFRINQYIKFFPAQEGGKNVKDVRQKAILEMLPKDLEITDLGKKVLGLKSWKE